MAGHVRYPCAGQMVGAHEGPQVDVSVLLAAFPFPFPIPFPIPFPVPFPISLGGEP